MMNLREKLLANKPKVNKIKINGDDYYIREFTVGEANQAIYGAQQELIKIARAQGIELNFDDETELTKQLAQVYDPYRLPRALAQRLCDENGNNLFNPQNEEDLKALSELDKSVYEELNNAIAELEPKNSPTEESSK